MRRVVVGILVALLVAPALLQAGELHGVQMDDVATIGDAELQLNGMGLRKKLWVKVYVAGLYLENESKDPAAIIDSEGSKRVVMHFMTDRATKAKMDAAWNDGFKANSEADYAALERRLTTFMGYFADMKVDDRVVMDIVPGEGVRVSINDVMKGAIPGDDFSKALLRVWLGDHPPSEDLKKGMLGS